MKSFVAALTLTVFATAGATAGAQEPAPDNAPNGALPNAGSPPATTAPTTPPPTAVMPAPPSVVAPSGPVIELPPEEKTPPVPAGPPPVPRGVDPSLLSNQAYATDLGAGRRIPIGAYGETELLFSKNQTTFTLRRLVLFFGYQFADWIAVYSEMEVENVSSFEIEQSYVELKPWKRLRLGMRLGLILLPIGIVNQYHEPPTFNGVDRPLVDQLIIPSTWRELGVSIFGTIVDGLHFQVLAIAGADGSKFTALGGFGPGLSRGFTTNVQNAAVAGRINFNRVMGLDMAVGFYYGSANNKDANLDGIKLGLVEADARFTRWGLSLRVEYARYFVDGADKITAFQRSQNITVPVAAVGSSGQGFYGEAGYNILYPVRQTNQQINVFGRYELVDTRADLPTVINPFPTDAQQFFTAGFTYKPRLELAFKFDYRRTLAGNDGSGGVDRFSLGIGFMY